MGIELATVLTVMGVVWAGDPISLNPSFSIGGSDTAVDNLLDGVLGILGMYGIPSHVVVMLADGMSGFRYSGRPESFTQLYRG